MGSILELLLGGIVLAGLVLVVVVTIKGTFNRGNNWGNSMKSEWGFDDDNGDDINQKPYC